MLARSGDLGRARAIADELGNASVAAFVASCEGDFAAAELDLAAALEGRRHAGHGISSANSAHVLAEWKMAADDLDTAERLLREELTIGQDGGSMLLAVRASAELAIISVLSGRLDDADELLAVCREARASDEDWGRRGGRALLAEALLAAAQQRHADADHCLEDALNVFRTSSLPFDEADCYIYMARLVGKDSSPMIESARAIYERIGAGGVWLKRVSPETE
jgi:hypothetical protein